MNLEQFQGVNAAYVLELYERYRQSSFGELMSCIA
jgi:hypothetical protein